MSERSGYVTIGGSIFGPDDKIPAELAKQITNPKALAGDSTEPQDVTVIPPKGGAGSGVDAWRAYADTQNVAIEADATRDEIIAELEAAGVPTE